MGTIIEPRLLAIFPTLEQSVRPKRFHLEKSLDSLQVKTTILAKIHEPLLNLSTKYYFVTSEKWGTIHRHTIFTEDNNTYPVTKEDGIDLMNFIPKKRSIDQRKDNGNDSNMTNGNGKNGKKKN